MKSINIDSNIIFLNEIKSKKYDSYKNLNVKKWRD